MKRVSTVGLPTGEASVYRPNQPQHGLRPRKKMANKVGDIGAVVQEMVGEIRRETGAREACGGAGPD